MSNSHRNLSRRGFLGRTLGAGAAAAAVSPLLPLFPSRAEAAPFPQRLVLVFWSGGTSPGQDVPMGTETDWSFQPLLSSLEPYKKQLIVFKNLRRRYDGSQGGHQGSTASTWTNARFTAKQGPGAWATGPSIDQLIASKVKQPTAFPTLELDVQSQDPGNLRSKTLFALDGVPLTGEKDPSRAFDRVFTGGFTVPAGDPMLAERLRRERKSVLDLVSGQLTTLHARLGVQDRRKLDQHLTALRATEQRLSMPGPAAGGGGGGTVAPPNKADFPKMDVMANDNFPAIGKMQMDLLVSALAGDRTRIVSLQWSQGNGDIIYRWAGSTRQHHALTHQGAILPEQDKINRWYYEQFAYLVNRMNQVKEGDGTLLDNSVVVFANELQSGFAHRTDPSPVIIAGGGAGYFKTGRYLKFPEIMAGGPGPNTSPNHSQLLVSLCQYMGADVNQVGDAGLGPGGPLPGLR